jgi:hypothetical protein
MKYLRLAGMAALVVALGALAFASAGVAAPPSSASTATASSATPIPINVSTATSTFTGTLDITKFVAQNGQVVALGTLTGTLTNLVTGVVTTITQDVVLPLLSTPTGSCPVLHLELGPLDVNLLGLTVHLDKVVLDITAQSGPGNLLGNLVCGVANVLNSNIAATALANLLNTLLGLV